MPSFFSKLLGKKKHSDNSGLLDGERYEAIPADTPPPPSSGTVPENITPTKSSPHKSKSHGLGLHLKRRAQSPPPPPPPEREPIAPAPHLSLDLPSSQAEEKQPTDLKLGLGNENITFSDAILRQKRLTPAETLYLVQKTSEIIQERGLEVLGVMRPHWFASPNHQEAQLKLLNCFLQSLAVRSSNEGASSSMTSEDPFENELRYTRDPHDVAAVFRWGLRHLQLENNAFALAAVEDWYQTFVTSERSEGYSSQAFDQILPPLLPVTHVHLIRSVLDLLTSLAAHSEENGISGNKLSKALGWWLISPRNVVKQPQWPSFYSDWEVAARQFEHLFLAYIRTQESQSRMPKRLTELVKNYPFEKSRKSEDGIFLPRPRFSTRSADALFIRIAVQADSESSIIHPLRIVINSLNSLPDKDASGDYLAIWESIREAAKTNTEEENQDTPPARFNLSTVIADESLRLLSLIPGMNDIPDISAFPSHTSQRSFSIIERPLSLASTFDHRSPADKANSISAPNMDLEHVTDWQAFSTTGFRSPSGISLTASLWDNDVEVTTPSVRRSNTKHTFSSNSEPPLPEEPTTPPLQSPLATVEQATMPVEVSTSRTATFSSPSLVKLDEAFVDFWADTLLDSVGQSWPTFVVCQLKPMPNLKVKDTTKSIEWIVIEQVVAAPAAPVAPVKEDEPEPVPPVPSTPPKSDSHKSHGFFSFTSPTRKRWGLFSSKQDTAPLLGRRRSGSKVSEMGEVLKEEDEMPKPPSDVSMTAPQSEESSSAVASTPKPEPLEPVAEMPKSDEPVSEEHPRTDNLSPIPEDVKLEEATAMEPVTGKPTGSETAISENLPPVPPKVEVEEVGPELPSKEKELPEPAAQENETLADSRAESDAVVVDDAVPLGESAVIVPRPEEKALPEVDESEHATETPAALKSIPATEEPAVIQGDVQEQPGESGEIPTVSDLDSKVVVPAEIDSANIVADEGSREPAVPSADEGLKVDTDPAPRSEMSFTVVEPTPIEEFGASIMSPVAAEPVIKPIREEDERDALEAGKEGDSQGFEFVQESESTEAEVIEESGETVAPTEEVPSETPQVLEPVRSQDAVDVPEELFSVSNQQVEETNEGESPKETLLLDETVPTEGSQTIVPELSREKEAHVEGTADEASQPEETPETVIVAPEVSTDTSIPISTAEEVIPEPPPVEETPIIRDASGEVTPAQETPLPDEPLAVSAEVPGEVSSIVNEEKDRNDEVSASVQSSMPEAAPVTEILPSEPATTVEEPHIHENYIPTEEETARVDTSAVETAPGAETTDILSNKDALVSPVDKEASGEQTPIIKSAIEQSIPAAVVGVSLVSALEDQQPNDLEVTTAEETSTAEEKPVEDVAGENPNRGPLSDEAEKVPFTKESLENVDVEDTTTTGVPIVDKTAVLQIPVIDSSEEPPAAPVAEVVSVPKVAIIDEEEPPRSEAATHAPAADIDEDEVPDQSIPKDVVPDQSIPKDEEPILVHEAVLSEDVTFATTPITTVPEVTEEVSTPPAANNTVFGIQADEKASDDEANVELAGTEVKPSDVNTSNETPNVEELHVEDATIPGTDAPAQEESVTVDDSTQSASIEQKPIASDSPPEETLAEESVQSPEASVERSAEEAATIGQGAAVEEPSSETDKVDSTEMINTEESSDPASEPVETIPSDVPEPVESEPAETHKPLVPEFDSLEEPPKQHFEKTQIEPSVNEKTEPDITSEAQANETEVQEAHDALVAEPENEPNSLLQHDSSALAAVSTPLGDTQTQSTDGLPHSDAVVPEKADAVAEPVTQAQDIVVPRADAIVEPATQVEDSSKPDVEPEAGTGVEDAQLAHSPDEAEVAESEEPVIDTSSAVVSHDPPIEEVIVEPVATDDTPVVGSEINELAQSTESSTAPKGETEPVLDLGPQAEATEPVEIAEEAKAELEIVSDKAQSTGEAQPEPTDSVPRVEAPFAGETTDATPVIDTEVVGEDAAPEALEPSTADRTDIIVGNQEAPAQPSVPEAPSTSEESGIPQDLRENIETQGANQVEGSTAVHPAVVDSDESQAVELTGSQTVSTVDNSQTEFPSENVETVETPTLGFNIPIPDQTALSNPIHEGDVAPSVEPPSDEVQPSLPAEDTSTPDPLDLATNTVVHADSISHEGSSANATAEASSQPVQAGFNVSEQSITSPSTQHISDPAITSQSASQSFPQSIEDTTPSANDVADTQDTIPSNHDDISDMKVESVQEPTVVAAVEPEGTTSVEPESSITKNLTVQVPEIEETRPIDTQTVVEADQKPPTDDARATIEPISEPQAGVAPTTEHQDTAPLSLVPAEAEPLAVDSQRADSEAPTFAEQTIEGTSEPRAHDSTQLDTFSTDITPVAVPEHIPAEDSSIPVPAEVEEITPSVETHQEEPPTRDDAAPADTEPISELDAHAAATTEHQDTAHLSFATVDDQPPTAEHSIDSLRADTEAPVVSDQDGDVTETANADRAYDLSVQPGSFSSNVEPELAVQPEESVPEPPAEPSGGAPVATDAQPIPSENVEAGGRAALEDIPSSTDAEATDLDSGINGNNAETSDGKALEEQPFDAVEAKSVPVDLDDTQTVSNEQPEPNVAPIDEASVPEPPSAVNETPEQVNPSSVAEPATALSSQEPEVRVPQAEEHASEDKAIAVDGSSSTRLADNESPEEIAEKQNEADSNAQHVQGLESDSILEVIEGTISQTESKVEPTGSPQSGSAKEYIPASEEFVAQSEDKPEVPQSADSEPAIKVDDVQEGSTRTSDNIAEQQPEITQVESASDEVSSPSRFPETSVESQEPSVNDQSKSQLQYDQPALAEDTVPSESMRTQSTEELPIGDVVAPEEMDVTAKPVTQAQDTDSNVIAGFAVQEQETFEPKLDPDTTEVEQQTNEEPIQSSDKVQEAETKEPSPPAASEESQAKDIFTATDEIAPSTEAPGEVDEPEVPVNTAGTGLDDVGPEPEPAGSAEEAKPKPEVISDEVQESGEAQTESTDIVAQINAHPAVESTEEAPVHDNEMVELEPTRSIEQDMTPIDVSEPPASNKADVAFEGVQAPVSQDELVQSSVSEDVSFASEVPAKDQSGDIGTNTETSAVPSIIVDSAESRAVEPTEDSALPGTEDVDAKSSSANVETVDAFALNVSDGEAVLQPIQSDVAASSTGPVVDEVQRSFVARDGSASELSVEAVNPAVNAPAVGEDLDANAKTSDASALDSSIPNPEEVVSQSNHELEAPAMEDSQSEPPLVANIEATDTLASNLNIPVSEEVASQPVQTDVPVHSVELPDEVRPSLTVHDPSVTDRSESVLHADPDVDENPSANVEAEVLSQSVLADTAAPDQSIPAPSTHDIADPATSAEFPASDTNPDTAPAAEPEGTTSKEFRSSEDSLVPAQEDEEVAQSQAPVETHQELPAEADLPSANVEPSSEPEPEPVPATEHEDKVLSPPVVIPTNVEPEVADYRTVDDSGGLLESVGTAGAAAVDETHGSFVQQPAALSSNVESEPVVETQQESTSEPASSEVPVATNPEPISSEAEDKVASRDIPGSNDVEAEGRPLDLDVSKTEVAVEGPDDVAPSNGTAGTNGTVMNGGSVDADTEGDNSENTSANQDQEDHIVSLDNGVDFGVLKDVPVEGVRSLDEASKERGFEFSSEGARQEELEDNRRELLF